MKIVKVVFATQNKGKQREAAEILGEGIEILTPEDCGVEGEAEETGATFAANSLLKAKYVSDRIFGDMGNALAKDVAAVFADDSGLETDALGGEPGIYTARYAGDDKNFTDNMDKLLAKLAEAGAVKPEERTARFRCTVTLIFRNGETSRHENGISLCEEGVSRHENGISQYEGILEGRIAASKAGHGGFGYDPVFIPTDSELSALASAAGLPEREIEALRGKTLAEIPEHLKNLISHRFKALLPVREALLKAQGDAPAEII